MFCMVSKEMTSHVMDYISSLSWRNKMIIQSFHCTPYLEQRSTVEHYRHLGTFYFNFVKLVPLFCKFFYIFWMWLIILFSAISAFVFDVSGLLFKRCTLLLPTKERLKFIFSKFSQVRKVKVTIFRNRMLSCKCLVYLI